MQLFLLYTINTVNARTHNRPAKERIYYYKYVVHAFDNSMSECVDHIINTVFMRTSRHDSTCVCVLMNICIHEMSTRKQFRREDMNVELVYTERGGRATLLATGKSHYIW